MLFPRVPSSVHRLFAQAGSEFKGRLCLLGSVFLGALYHITNRLLLAMAAFGRPAPVLVRRGPGRDNPIS